MRAHHGRRHGRVRHGVRGLIGRGKGDPESGAVNNRRRKRGGGRNYSGFGSPREVVKIANSLPMIRKLTVLRCLSS